MLSVKIYTELNIRWRDERLIGAKKLLSTRKSRVPIGVDYLLRLVPGFCCPEIKNIDSVYLDNWINITGKICESGGLSDDNRRDSVPQEKGAKAPSKEDRQAKHLTENGIEMMSGTVPERYVQFKRKSCKLSLVRTNLELQKINLREVIPMRKNLIRIKQR